MNDKLIHRVANKYREWLLSQKLAHIKDSQAYVLNNLTNARNKSKQILTWANRFFSGSEQRFQYSTWDNKCHSGIVSSDVYKTIATKMVPNLSTDVLASTQCAVAMLKKLIEKPITPTISLQEAIDEIRAIVQQWPEVKFRDNILSVGVGQILLEDDNEQVDLGSFWVHINITTPLDSLKIESINEIESSHGFFHPHVSLQSLCIGEGALISQEALLQGRLEDFFRIIHAVLNTYNKESPHEALSEWYDPNHDDEFYCEFCEQWYSDDCSCYCATCENTYCDECSPGGGCCTGCGEWCCENCSTICHKCEETVCSQCDIMCSACKYTFCSSCTSSCGVCDEQYCSSCKESCERCGDSICEDCIATCDCCEENCCTSCVSAVCELCNKDICEGCETACQHCNKTICTTCERNTCEDCGVHMCEECESEHNCLLAKATG